MTRHWARAFSLVLFVSAAKDDAQSAGKIKELRQVVLPALQTYRDVGDQDPVRAAVRSVMGQDWKPSGDWKIWIDKMEHDNERRLG